MNPFHDNDTAEIRLFRTIAELNHRILHAPSAEERTMLRCSVTTIRQELVKLIEAMPIYSEEDARRAHTAQSLGIVPLGSA